ncbi:leucine-rich repeat-containing protein 57-like [Chrysoperla carnea]|uniref:leucine-rich repeat-containing protein 57-like n=1 Tax=Chrysoperla carnea TaxID=189513 RepID=UPI001D068005|nr:leucine-rich repeat-containing protein 57-like [Chrysoperla carnea]
MGNSGLKQHFETSKKTGVLTLSNEKLTEFPPQLKQLHGNLRSLDISNNKFIILPDEIKNFNQLKHFNFSNNKLKTLPETIGDVQKLETLNGNSNVLFKLPKSLSNLRNLKQVSLSNNNFQEFPLVFGGLKHLDLLDLSQNKITTIPDEVKLLYVIELNVNQNQISTISKSIASAPRLKTLRLEENCLPIAEIHTEILKNSEISTLSLEGNLFDTKQFMETDGYEDYMIRFTAVKKKMF